MNERFYLLKIQLLDIEKKRQFATGIISLRASPKRFNAKTVSIIAMPGYNERCDALKT